MHASEPNLIHLHQETSLLLIYLAKGEETECVCAWGGKEKKQLANTSQHPLQGWGNVARGRGLESVLNQREREGGRERERGRWCILRILLLLHACPAAAKLRSRCSPPPCISFAVETSGISSRAGERKAEQPCCPQRGEKKKSELSHRAGNKRERNAQQRGTHVAPCIT